MEDFFEIDFMDIESTESGDAIPLRYQVNDTKYIHVVDGGYQATGDDLVEYIKRYYDRPTYLDNVIVTHPDGDHAGGLRAVLEGFEIGALWMLRPWAYANELLPRFSRFTSVDNLRKRLREIYPNIAALEDIAVDREIPIYEPFQGANIGEFHVVAPAKPRYLDLIVQSDKTPESALRDDARGTGIGGVLAQVAANVVEFVRAAWGAEIFSEEETSAENEMSVIQYAYLCNQKILLTGDAGRGALTEAADYTEAGGVTLPGIDRFQVPHHGSRRNVSTAVLDRWLGSRLPRRPLEGSETFTAIISSAKADKDHPRKAVVRAMIHRGAKVISTEGRNIRTSHNAPSREGWSAVTPMPYPDDQEE
ncbi:ComEC/Rec2 family competence protein [Immundisolibacter sp.]|jgi:hypothetical protein|uniref:ComEC/Rec2 family competence protein n=1 Tax=Immundisolibacter sp. TaxID=1934948 RepID=UPI003F86EFDE